MKKVCQRVLVTALLLAALLQLPFSAARALSFPDVKSGDWFAEDVALLTQLGIINGMDDGLFHPNDRVRRGEFMKMLTIAGEYLYSTTPPKGIHWSESYWNALNDAGVLEVVETNANEVQTAYPLIPLTFAELDKTINRYEMAFLINRIVYLVYYENQMALADSSGDSFSNHIADYSAMNAAYRGSVEQVYMKGILTGYTDTSFQGDNTLTRAEAARVITRLLYNSRREKQSWTVEREYETNPAFVSFAVRYRGLSDAERRTQLFGNAGKTYFTSAADAQNYMVSISIPIWKLNEATGQKYSATAYITVHKLVEKEVRAIFDEIYNSPERFPIKAIGGARYTDTLRHSWGCAIDINPNENYYINYRTGATVGSFCYKNGSSPYCITPDSSVVKAFAKYGWGWGGQGWSTAADYMHFSILASGG
ncbi:MAG: S-layer homology domain-containing protein [Oscillospiraceae bacterium]|jgi:hypothetical protein|nr:S-layer homology domain-containing protein [Oscillospiraceae bacterium]